MKLPFTYRRDLFIPALMLSVVGHAGYVTAGSLFASPHASFSVKQAPTSMEVVIVKEKVEVTDLRDSVSVISAPSAASEIFVTQKKEVTRSEENSRRIYIPEHRGALDIPRAKYVTNPAPEYPKYAQESGWEGVVLLDVRVDRKGFPNEIEVEKSSGYQILDNAAEKAVQNWIFEPARLGAVTFSSRIKIPIRFVLIPE